MFDHVLHVFDNVFCHQRRVRLLKTWSKISLASKHMINVVASKHIIQDILASCLFFLNIIITNFTYFFYLLIYKVFIFFSNILMRRAYFYLWNDINLFKPKSCQINIEIFIKFDLTRFYCQHVDKIKHVLSVY